MATAIWKRAWFIFAAFSTIGGVFAFFDYLTAQPDYALTLHLKSSEAVIVNQKTAPGLSILFNGAEVDSLYLSRLELRNTGKRALTQDFIFEPVTIKTGGTGKVLQVSPSNSSITHTSDSISLRWDLFNPSEAIEVVVFSSAPIVPVVKQKIREIPSVVYIDEIKNPPATKRLQSPVSITLIVVLILSVLSTLDAFFLIRADHKLQKIFNFANSLRNAQSMEKATYLGRLSTLYLDYYQSVRSPVCKPDRVIANVSSHLERTGATLTARDLEHARTAAIMWTRHANLYDLRTLFIFAGPLGFGFNLIGIAIALLV